MLSGGCFWWLLRTTGKRTVSKGCRVISYEVEIPQDRGWSISICLRALCKRFIDHRAYGQWKIRLLSERKRKLVIHWKSQMAWYFRNFFKLSMWLQPEQSDGPKRWVDRFRMETLLATARSSVATMKSKVCKWRSPLFFIIFRGYIVLWSC